MSALVFVPFNLNRADAMVNKSDIGSFGGPVPANNPTSGRFSSIVRSTGDGGVSARFAEPAHWPTENQAASADESHSSPRAISGAVAPAAVPEDSAHVSNRTALADNMALIRHQPIPRRLDPRLQCPSCGRTPTPGDLGEWRTGLVSRMMVCSACGQYERRTGRVRPPYLESKRRKGNGQRDYNKKR
uniref:GATA-type domain-containing protein n=1 Tax=Mycena chlorophos TaxID=658473 RepID=A0ABQ0LXE1_MYCCL|nr:predicted protein [Mycena chlorophos]